MKQTFVTRLLGRFWIVPFFSATPAFACMGASAEIAQERDANVVIEGRLIELSYNPSQKESSLVFSTVKTFRGIRKAKWTVTMRGASVPTTLKDYMKRFGNLNEVGIKITPKVTNGAYIVDNSCKMNRDDWFIRSVNSYQVVEISVDLSARWP